MRAEAKREARIAAHEAEIAAEKKIEARLKARDDDAAQRTQGQKMAAIEQAAADRVKAFAAKNPDYQKRMDAATQDPAFVVPALMYAHMVHSELGPQLAYELAGMSAKEFRAIADLPQNRMLAALGRLEERIETRAASHQAGPTSARKPVDPAVKPYQPVGTSAVVTAVPSHELVKTDPQAWMRQRDLEERRRKSGR